MFIARVLGGFLIERTLNNSFHLLFHYPYITPIYPIVLYKPYIIPIRPLKGGGFRGLATRAQLPEGPLGGDPGGRGGHTSGLKVERV